MTQSKLPADTSADVLVIGGGAVGAWCALKLVRSGRSVTLLEERDRFAARASFGNSGLLTVSAAGPLAEPGIAGRALRWSLQPNGPVRIRPRPSGHSVSWVRRFREAASRERARSTTLVSRALVRRSRPLVEALVGESPIDCKYRRAGLVACFTTARAHEFALASLVENSDPDLEAIPLDGTAVRTRTELAGDGVVGGIFYPEDASLDPAAMTLAAMELARVAGADLETTARVHRLVPVGGRRAAAETARGLVHADEIVVAAGYGSRTLAAPFGGASLIAPGRGYSDDVLAPAAGLGAPIRMVEARIVAAPLGDRLRITSRLELGYADESVEQRRADASLLLASSYLAEGTRLTRVRAPWTGIRPLTPDGLPLVGRDPWIENVIWATGHGHLGISHAAVTGELVTELVTGADDSRELDLLRVDRFERPALRMTAMQRVSS